MKASLVAYIFRGLHKQSEVKIVKYGFVRGFPKRPATQIGLLEILGVYLFALRKAERSMFPNHSIT
jgi:hypothetical protein